MNEKEIFKDLCENDFSFYVEQFLKVIEPETKFEWNWHMNTLCHYCEQVYYGHIPNLDINIPPRMLKSLIVSVLFPTWIWTKEPSFKIIAVSATHSLSSLFNMKRREIVESEEYQSLWPTGIKEDMNRIDRFENEFNGFMVSTSVGGSLIGTGANCFSGDTVIITNNGYKTIKELYEQGVHSQDMVLSFNHENNKLEYKRILAARKSKSNKIITTTFDNGSSVTSTSDHKFFTVGRGYLPIQETAHQKDLSFLSVMSEEDFKKFDYLQRLFILGQNILCRMRLLKVWKNRKIFISRLYKENKKISECVLLIGMLKEKCFRAFRENKQVLFMRKTCQKAIQEGHKKIESLFFMQRDWIIKVSKEINSNRLLQNVFESISQKSEGDVLFEGVCYEAPLSRHDGSKQSKPQTDPKSYRQEHGALFFKNKRSNKVQNKEMCSVRVCGKPSGSPYKSQPQGQSTRKSSGIMRILSFILPPLERYSINRETKATLYEKQLQEIDVYDLEIEDNHNFFANGILVHNCILSDDLLEVKDAFSNTKREYVNQWYSSALYNRVQDKRTARRININQRLHFNDLSAHLKKNYDFKALVLPMIKGEKDLSTVDFKDPREVGEYLHPARYSEKEKNDEYRGLGIYGWSSQMQQNPLIEGGGIIKNEWIRRWSVLPTEFDKEIITADLSFKGKKDSDYVCFQCWGMKGSIKYLIDIVRGQWSYAQTKENFKIFCAKHPNASLKYIEDKANGPALISDMAQEINGLIGWPEDKKLAKMDKIQRLHVCSSDYENGLVLLAPDIALVDEYILELTSFTDKGSTTGNDDMVDTGTMALIQFKESTYFAEA